MKNPPSRFPLHDSIFEILVDRVRDYGIFVLDPQGRIVTWNTGARLLKGYLPEEIIGKHFSVFYLPDAVAQGWPQQELKVATMQGRFEDEGWRLRKDGSRFWANVIITALRDDDGHLLGFSKITRDLTARREAEEEMRQSEERFRLLIEGVQDYAVYMLDPEGIVVSWNAGAQKMKGYVREEIVGRHLSTFYRQEDIEAGRPWEEIATARRTGRAEDEGWRVRKSGERFWARVVVSALYDHDGRLRGYAKVTQDLSQREYARGLELTAQRVNEFIAMLAHELRNPLAPIRTAVHLMERLPAGDPGHEQMRKTVERQSGHLMRIVDDMLDIARVTRGTLSIERGRVDLAEVVARALEIAKASAAEVRHDWNVQLPATPLLVSGDIGRLTQVVANLLTNATRFTPQGGSIWIKGSKEDGQILLCVRDTGRGIAAEHFETIFGMFVQGKEALHRVGGGLGVGLALARRIAELHGGTIEVKSGGEGKGSEFTLRLPADVSAQAEAPAVQADARPAEKITARRVLIVDDNIDAAATLNELMRSLGHATQVVHDGQQALLIAEQFKPDVVLLDIGLPGMNGYEVARRLRQGGRAMKIIAITGWGTETDRSRSAEAGFDRHLVKPVDESELQRLIEQNGGSTSIH
jgi:PAS domain S-box-containing protein